jgi:octaprenyl-diphosphate synthase
MHAGARHLLAREGKRLRPMCVALAARVGSGFGPAVRELAVAVELVHNATLLHDDVVDLGEVRRGAPAARVIYGNAASVYAGDWLLVEALQRIQGTGFADLLERAIAVLKEMLVAESLQLANRGSMRSSVADYFRVVEGKTASLFRWALYAGGRAGGVSPEGCDALEDYGRHLGVAFQVVDDVLDVSGEPEVVGKSLFADLREGKMTYPLLLAVERDPALRARMSEACANGGALDPEIERQAGVALRETGALADSLALARRRSAEAIASLGVLAPSRGREALESIAVAMLHRNK